jgi:hypothetical protein
VSKDLPWLHIRKPDALVIIDGKVFMPVNYRAYALKQASEGKMTTHVFSALTWWTPAFWRRECSWMGF